MTAYVKQLGRRDEFVELIKWHFEIVWVFLPDNQSNGTHNSTGPALGFYIHRSVSLIGLEMESRDAYFRCARD